MSANDDGAFLRFWGQKKSSLGQSKGSDVPMKIGDHHRAKSGFRIDALDVKAGGRTVVSLLADNGTVGRVHTEIASHGRPRRNDRSHLKALKTERNQVRALRSHAIDEQFALIAASKMCLVAEPGIDPLGRAGEGVNLVNGEIINTQRILIWFRVGPGSSALNEDQPFWRYERTGRVINVIDQFSGSLPGLKVNKGGGPRRFARRESIGYGENGAGMGQGCAANDGAAEVFEGSDGSGKTVTR